MKSIWPDSLRALGSRLPLKEPDGTSGPHNDSTGGIHGNDSKTGWLSMSSADLIQIGLLIVSFLVGLVILWYTSETWKLRKEAQKQNDHAIMPIVMLEGATDLPLTEHDANMPSFKIVLRNLGLGPAFNIEIEPLKGLETEIRFRHSTSLAAGDRQPVIVS